MLPSEIRRVLHEELAPVSLDAALHDVRRRARRDRGRRIALFVATAAALVGAFVAIPRLGGEPKAGPVDEPGIVIPKNAVPWSDRTDYEEWLPPAPEPRTPTTPCTASDLTVDRIDTDGMSQRLLTTVTVAKATAGRCTLAGTPKLTGVDGNGRRVDIPRDPSSLPFPQYGESPATIDQHEVARATIVTCTGGEGAGDTTYSFRDVELVLTDGSTLAARRDLQSGCAFQVSPFLREDAPIERPARWTLRSDVTLPDSVRAGQVLEYVVTLTNDGQAGVSLAPCGGFSETLAFEDMNGNATRKPLFERYRLNCDDEPVLAPGESRPYVMRLDVPSSAPGGEARLTWQLVDSTPDFAGQGFVEVRSATPASGEPATSEHRAREVMAAFVDYAREPGVKTASRLQTVDGTIALGLGSTIVHTLDWAAAQKDPARWRLAPEGGFAGRVGTFSAVETLARYDGELTTSYGPHPHCAGPALDPPTSMKGLGQVSVQPVLPDTGSCLEWFSVDLWIDEVDRVVGVTLDLWEP